MMKRSLDILGAIVAILLMGFPMIFISMAVILTSPGPAFFVQERLGKDLKPFKMIKFRTMFDGAEHQGTRLFSFSDDYRITKLGYYLRKYSLDELPQLFNVLLGSMSLVGPRPPVTYELGPLKNFSADLLNRFTVKPGITGLAQISGRNHLNWDAKIKLDNQYIFQFSEQGTRLDLKILIKTLIIVLAAKDTIEQNY